MEALDRGHEVRRLDALVVGLGFGGIYTLHKLLNEHGLNVEGIDKAAGVGGTWYWNRYPGALSDCESVVYQYSFDRDLYAETGWTSKYVRQPQLLAYLNGVVDRFALRGNIKLETAMTGADFDEETGLWTVHTDRDLTYECRFLVTGLGLLSATNVPHLEGIEEFRGRVVHTGAWPEDLDLTGKRVGVIGNGSTGSQVITACAPTVGHLTSFQRTPQYSVPAGNREMTADELARVYDDVDGFWDGVWSSKSAMGFKESTVPTLSVSPEERESIFEAAWTEGGGFRFMYQTFGDIATNVEANEEAASFIRRKIAAIVKDPETARLLTPTEMYARRPVCDSGYYETFNRPNVSLVNLKENPIARLDETAVITADGKRHELDVLVLATGFDAVDGNYLRVTIRGRDAQPLQEHWSNGPTSYLGMTTSGFPNLFMILGPNGPFTNLVPAIETQVEWISDAIGHAVEHEISWIEARPEAEAEWTKVCNEVAEQYLFTRAGSWIFGTNVPGREPSVVFYLGGMEEYRSIIDREASADYPGHRAAAQQPSYAV